MAQVQQQQVLRQCLMDLRAQLAAPVLLLPAPAPLAARPPRRPAAVLLWLLLPQLLLQLLRLRCLRLPSLLLAHGSAACQQAVRWCC